MHVGRVGDGGSQNGGGDAAGAWWPEEGFVGGWNDSKIGPAALRKRSLITAGVVGELVLGEGFNFQLGESRRARGQGVGRDTVVLDELLDWNPDTWSCGCGATAWRSTRLRDERRALCCRRLLPSSGSERSFFVLGEVRDKQRCGGRWWRWRRRWQQRAEAAAGAGVPYHDGQQYTGTLGLGQQEWRRAVYVGPGWTGAWLAGTDWEVWERRGQSLRASACRPVSLGSGVSGHGSQRPSSWDSGSQRPNGGGRASARLARASQSPRLL